MQTEDRLREDRDWNEDADWDSKLTESEAQPETAAMIAMGCQRCAAVFKARRVRRGIKRAPGDRWKQFVFWTDMQMSKDICKKGNGMVMSVYRYGNYCNGISVQLKHNI